MEVEARLARLERQCRWYRAALLAVAGVGLAAIVGAASAPVADKLQARELEVLSPSGAVVFAVHADAHGDGEWIVYSGAGKQLASVGTNRSGHGALHVMSRDGERKVFIAGTDRDSEANAGGVVGVLNAKGMPAAVMISDPTGKGHVITPGQ
jgi:hypothetical protein